MMNEDYRIEISGFHPSQEIRLALETWIEKLQCLAPSNSFVVTNLVRKGRLFEMLVEINSKPIRFAARASEATFKGALDTLSKELWGQIAAWKRNRFIV